MNPVPCTPEALEALPSAIWAPGCASPSVYSGAPIEMVRQMAAEMGPHVSPEEAIHTLLAALARHRRIVIGLPNDLPEDVLAGLFVFALLDQGVCRPMPDA